MRGFLLLYYAHPSVLARPSDNMLSSGRLGFYAFALLYRFFCACFSQGLFFRACRRCRILSHLCLLACVRSRAAVKRRARVLRVRRGYAVFCCYFWCFCAINESVCDFESTRDKGVGVQNPAVSRRDWASADSTEAHEVLSARLTRRAEREVLRAGSNTGISGVILYGSRQSRTCDLSFTRGSAHVAAAKKKGSVARTTACPSRVQRIFYCVIPFAFRSIEHAAPSFRRLRRFLARVHALAYGRDCFALIYTNGCAPARYNGIMRRDESPPEE